MEKYFAPQFLPFDSVQYIYLLTVWLACETSVSPRSSPPGTFREEERLRLSGRNSILMTQSNSSARNVPIGEERGETGVFAGYGVVYICLDITLLILLTSFAKAVLSDCQL